MNQVFQKIFRNHSTRVLSLLLITLLIVISYFLVHSYYVQLDIHEKKILSRLDAIANTTSTQIEGDELEQLLLTYTKMDQIESNDQDSIYKKIHELLADVKLKNKLKSELYTLSLNESKDAFYFGVSSSENPFYRHPYDHFPAQLLKDFEKGGKIGVYEDENGHWLSAFSTIKNSKGETIAILQADSLFDEFIDEARSTIFINIAISLVFTLVLLLFLLRSMQSILRKEDKMTNHLISSKKALEEKNQDIMDSINYAKKIQDAILPQKSKISQVLPDSFVFFKPRDIVSGDFYWFKQIEDKIIIASVDCTGHGVPGAFMSMIGSVLLDDIVAKNKIVKPCEILDQLHFKVVEALRQDSKNVDSKDGMDVAICVIDQKANTLSYSGACRPLVFIRNNELKRIKADASSIGGYTINKSCYNAHNIDLEAGDTFYIFSDGYPDQFGGDKNKKYMTPPFRRFLLSISNEAMPKQKELLDEEFNRWKGDEEQVDDVLVIGFRL